MNPATRRFVTAVSCLALGWGCGRSNDAEVQRARAEAEVARAQAEAEAAKARAQAEIARAEIEKLKGASSQPQTNDAPPTQPGAKSPAAESSPPAQASAAGASTTPPPGKLVLDHPMTRPGVLRTMNVAFGQYGGQPKLEAGTGVKLGFGHTAPAIWAKEYLGNKYRAQFEMKFENEHGWAVCVLNGPGYGNSSDVGYGCRINQRNVTLLRDGKEQETIEKPQGGPEWAQVEANVDGGNIEVNLNGVPVAGMEDPQPLAGSLNGWFGLVGSGVTFRNLKLWSPESDINRERQLTPPVTEQPTQNGELLYELKLAGAELGSEWHKTQPEFSIVKDGALVLSGPNGTPDVILTKPLTPELACEVEFEYPEQEAVNFSVVLLSADQVPASSKEYAGWLVSLPGGNGKSTIRWQSGPKNSGDGTWTQAPDLAATGYYAPIPQRKYKLRIETHGRELRVFLDGGLLLKGERPVDSPTASTLFGLRQFYGGSKVHSVRLYRIAP